MSSSSNNTDTKVSTEESYIFPDYVHIISSDKHTFVLNGALLRHSGMFRSLFAESIVGLTQQNTEKVNDVTINEIDSEFDHRVIGVFVDYLHYREQQVPKQNKENIPEYDIVSKIKKHMNGDKDDENKLLLDMLTMCNQFDC